VECNATLTGAKHIEDAEYIQASMKKQERKGNQKTILLWVLFVVVTIVIDVYIIYMGSVSEMPDGSPFQMSLIWRQFPWYLPVGFVLGFHFDWLNLKIREKLGKPQKHLPDWCNFGIRALGVVAWFLLECRIISAVMFYV
jgi:hypothetical protein